MDIKSKLSLFLHEYGLEAGEYKLSQNTLSNLCGMGEKHYFSLIMRLSPLEYKLNTIDKAMM